MNPLLEKFNEYKSIVNYKFVYEFANGITIEYKLRQTEFPHLLGLHKLTDIPIIQQFKDINQTNISAKYILSRIKKSSLRAKYILFEDKHPGYNHLCIGCAPKGNYAESFFYQPTDRYIVNQNVCAISKVQIFDADGNLFLEDNF